MTFPKDGGRGFASDLFHTFLVGLPMSFFAYFFSFLVFLPSAPLCSSPKKGAASCKVVKILHTFVQNETIKENLTATYRRRQRDGSGPRILASARLHRLFRQPQIFAGGDLQIDRRAGHNCHGMPHALDQLASSVATKSPRLA